MDRFYVFLGVKYEAAKLRWAGRGGAQRPVWGGNELKKTGARSARACTRGQNPLVLYVLIVKLTKEQRRRVSRGRD